MDEAFFGEWLKKQRSSRGLTQKQLAQKIGCATITLRKIESGERNPSVQIVKRIAEIFQIPSKEEKDFLRFSRGWRSVPAEVEEDVSWRSSSQSHEDEVPARSGIHLATFFFTDIEGSVRLWESAPERMKVALQRHHAIMQEAITSNRGEVFQTVGDGFCAVFAAGSNAISAAVTAQRKLYQASWDLPFSMRVRIGIHTGEAEPLEHGSSTGGYASNPTMNRVARILNAAHGGQVLLSSVTKELLKDRLPANTEFLDLGKHYLKDLARPEHLFQLDITGLPSFFPPLKTLNTRHNLPVQLTSFVGREKEITDVIDLLGRSRLITLTGPGGNGKTRLSLQVGSELVDRYLDGIWIVELASILDPMLIPRTAANALGLREEPQRPVLDMLCDYLRDKHLLLILDNCEHLVEACAEFAHRLLQAGSQIGILATSREILGVGGEFSYLVPSLQLPDMQNLPTVEDLSQYEAIRLFSERASAKTQRFSITDENAFSIAQICYQLDGIPLAIELAAGKIGALSAQQIAERLHDRFQLLTGGSRTALPRHQTLRAMIEWSYDLLSPVEQILFRRLSVFLNGWTLEAAESVCSDKATTLDRVLKKKDILELLDQLVNKSLVMTEERHGLIRYRFLEMIRQFGVDKLVEAGESEGLGDQHLDFFIQFAETADPLFRSAEQIKWLQQLDDEHENLHSALKWTARKSSAEPALQLAGALAVFWMMRSLWGEGTKWLEIALKKAPLELEKMKSAEKAARAKAGSGDEISVQNLRVLEKRRARWHRSLGFVHFGLSSLHESKKHVQEALQLLGYPFPKSGPQLLFGLFLQIYQQARHRLFPTHFTGVVSIKEERDVVIEAARLYELMGKICFYTNENLAIMYSVLRSLNEAEKAGSSPELASAYSGMAILMGLARLHSLTEIYVDRSIAVAEDANQPSNLVTVSVITSVYKITVGKWDEVRSRVEVAKTICEHLGDYSQWGDCAILLGESAFFAGDIPYALNVFQELLQDSRRRAQNRTQICWGLIGVSMNNIRLGHPAVAVPMLEEALQFLEDSSNLADSIKAAGQLALAYLRLDQEVKALASADKVLVLAVNISPTVYSMDIGFAAATEVYFELWENSLQDSGRRLDSDKYKLAVEKILKLLQAFEKVFPIGQPITPYYRGWYQSLIGKPHIAIRDWDEGLRAAKKFNMPYEEGLLHLKLGSHAQNGSNECREHLERAIQIFNKMNASHELHLAEGEAKKAGF